MKILHIYKDMYPPITGGIEKHIHLLCHLSQENGLDVEVLIANRKNKTEISFEDTIKITKVAQLGRFMSAPITPSLHHYIRKIKADIYHFHHPNPTAEIAYLLAGSPGKLVISYHSDIIRQALIMPLYKPFLHLFFNHASRILPTSENYLASSPILRHYKTKCTVVPLAINSDQFKANNDTLNKAHELKTKYPGQLHVLFIGKLRYYKGLGVLINAAKLTKGIHFWIIGKAPKVKQEAEYLNLVKSLNLDSHVHFLGELSDHDLLPYLYACDVFCLPSIERSEAYGLVQLEAHACGKPVISTDLNTGVSFVNQHMKTGLIVKPKDPVDLAKAFEYCINHPQEMLDMGKYAKVRVEKEFSTTLMFKKVKEVYDSVLE